LAMDSGLPLVVVEIVLRRVPMEPHGPVGVQAFFPVADLVFHLNPYKQHTTIWYKPRQMPIFRKTL
jgi:hypothetical protein